MHSRFDTEARIAVAQATDIARELGHSQVGPDHLLLGLLANMRGTAYAALADHGLRFDTARDLVVDVHAESETGKDPNAEPSDTLDRLDEDRAALRAIGIDLDRVRAAVAENLGADLTEGWGSRPERAGRGRRGRGGRQDGAPAGRKQHHGRGRRGPRSRRDEDGWFSPCLRDLLREVRRAAMRDRRDDRDSDVHHGPTGMTGERLVLALLDCDDPHLRALLATATDLDGMRVRLEGSGEPGATAG
jgi:hypothetical protein